MKEHYKTSELYTGVAIGNQSAVHLYEKIGFRKTGLIENDMIEMCLYVN